MVVSSSETMLEDLYGNKAENMLGNFGIRYRFASYNLKEMTKVSESMGFRVVETAGGTPVTECLISAEQLAAMETGTCLVNIGGTIKYVTHFFPAEKMLHTKFSKFDIPKHKRNDVSAVFDIKSLVPKHMKNNPFNIF